MSNKRGIFWTILVSLSLYACDAPEQSKPELVPTTGVFTQFEEDIYQKRYAEMVKAFASGKLTTNYDTEIYFGQNLAVSPLPRGQAENLTSELIAELTLYAQQNNSDSFMIVENGKVVSESFFNNQSPESLINAKSLAKPLGVLAVGRAIDRGFIKDLDQAASDFIIEWKGTDREFIKIRHLLDMRSGLLEQSQARGADHVLNRAYLHPRHEEVIIHEYPLVNPPGSRYDYSNANSELIAVIIKRATSQTYPEWLTNEVLAPLGAGGGKIWMNREDGTAHSGCCVGLTSETYLKMGLLILQGGVWEDKQLVSQEFIAEMLTPTPQNPFAGMGLYLGKKYSKNRGATNPDGKSGFGGTLHSEPYIDKDIALFDGNGNQVVYMMPSRNIVIMRLGPRPRSEAPWDNAYLPNKVSRSLDGN